MALKGQRQKVEAFRRKLIDEPTNTEHSGDEQSQLSGPMQNYDTQTDLAAPSPQTRAAAKRAQTHASGDSPFQYDEEGNDESVNGLPQMTTLGMECSSEEGSQDKRSYTVFTLPIIFFSTRPYYSPMGY